MVSEAISGAGITLDAKKPTTLTFSELYTWVIWQFPECLTLSLTMHTLILPVKNQQNPPVSRKWHIYQHRWQRTVFCKSAIDDKAATAGG